MRKHRLRLTLLSASMLFMPCYESMIEESNGIDLNLEEDSKEDDKSKDKEEKKEEKRSKKFKERKTDADEDEDEKKKEKEFHHFFEAVFLDDDDTVLYRIHVLVGEDVVYKGQIPHRKSRNGKRYVFIGWDKPLENIQSDTVFYPEFEEVEDF